MSALRLAILGAGNMGRALAGGLLRSGLRPEAIACGEREPGARAALRAELGLAAGEDNVAAVAGATVVVLAVKPQDAAAVLSSLRPAFAGSRPLLLSVAAGLRVAALAELAGGGLDVVRAMPNRPALVGAGATGLYADASVLPARRELAERVMRAVGLTVWVSTEDQLDLVTALSGSGPAYFFRLAELLADAAVGAGLAADAAWPLAVATLNGAGLMAGAAGADLARLRAEVTSRGGTTEAALRALDEGGLADLARKAIDAAARRGRELAAAPAPLNVAAQVRS